MTINVTHQYGCVFGNNTTNCTWDPITPQILNGTAPVADLFSTVKVGNTVEATSIGGPGGRWIAIGTLFPTPGIENWFATDVFGDPDAAPAPLTANYGLTYNTTPDCTKCNGTVCNASSVNITITRVGADVFDKMLRPGENFEYFDRMDNSSIWVKFVSGEASSSLCPNATMMTGIQPVSVFVVHVTPACRQRDDPGNDGSGEYHAHRKYHRSRHDDHSRVSHRSPRSVHSGSSVQRRSLAGRQINSFFSIIAKELPDFFPTLSLNDNPCTRLTGRFIPGRQ